MKRVSITVLTILAMASTANAWGKSDSKKSGPPAPPPPGPVQTLDQCARGLFVGLEIWPSSAERACGRDNEGNGKPKQRTDINYQKCVIDLTRQLFSQKSRRVTVGEVSHDTYIDEAAAICQLATRADLGRCMVDLTSKVPMEISQANQYCEQRIDQDTRLVSCAMNLEKSFPSYAQRTSYSIFICRQSASPTFDKCISQLYNEGALEVENNRLQYDALRLCKNGTNTALNKCIVDEVQNRGRNGSSAAVVCMERHDAEARARAEAERRRIEEQRRTEAAKAEAAKKAAEDKRRQEEKRKADEQKRQDEKRRQEEQRRKDEENRKQQEKPQPLPTQPTKPPAPATPSQPSVDSSKQQEEQKRKDEEKRRQEEQRKADEKRKADEQKKKDEESKKQEPQQPAAPLDPVTTPPPPPPDGGLIVDLPMPE